VAPGSAVAGRSADGGLPFACVGCVTGAVVGVGLGSGVEPGCEVDVNDDEIATGLARAGLAAPEVALGGKALL